MPSFLSELNKRNKQGGKSFINTISGVDIKGLEKARSIKSSQFEPEPLEKIQTSFKRAGSVSKAAPASNAIQAPPLPSFMDQLAQSQVKPVDPILKPRNLAESTDPKGRVRTLGQRQQFTKAKQPFIEARKESKAIEKERLDKVKNEARERLKILEPIFRQALKDKDVEKSNSMRSEIGRLRAEAHPLGLGILQGLGKSAPLLLEGTLKSRDIVGEIEKVQGKDFLSDATAQSAFKLGSTGTQIGTQALQYATVNAGAKALGLTGKLSKILGSGVKAKFLAEEAIDLAVDIVVQAPREWQEALTNDKSIGADILDMLGNRGWDILINAGIGAFTKDGKAAIGSLFEKNPALIESVVKQADPSIAKSIQQELGLTIDDTLKTLQPPAKPGILAPDLQPVRTIDPIKEVQVQDAMKNISSTPEPVDISQLPLLERVKQDTFYHGSPNKFTELDINKLGTNSGNKGFYGEGFYFSNNKDVASFYGDNIIETKMNFKKPYHITSDTPISEIAKFAGVETPKTISNTPLSRDIPDIITENSKKFTDSLKAQGYDGVIVGNGKEVVIFDNSPIAKLKSDLDPEIVEMIRRAKPVKSEVPKDPEVVEMIRRAQDPTQAVKIEPDVDFETGLTKHLQGLNDAKRIQDAKIEQPKTFRERLATPIEPTQAAKIETEKVVKNTIDDLVDRADSISLPSKIEDEFRSTIPIDDALRGDGLYTTPDTVDEIVKQGTAWKNSVPDKFKELSNAIGDVKMNNIGTFGKWTKDVFRNFEKGFGENFNKVKKNILDPFDASKKLKVEDEIRITNRLKSEVVDKLGIVKGKKKSKFVQRYGEGNISLEDLQKEFPKDWNNIVKADEWFRKEYDQILDEVNAALVTMGKDTVPKRNDYYRHFQEMGNTWEGIRNTFKDSQLISPELVGISEFTKPTSKFASFKQKRGLGEYKEDAVGGFLNYLPAAGYAKHIDPHIGKFRNLRNYMATTATENDKGLANMLEYIDEFSNTLAGKTGFVDRSIQKLIGRKSLNVTNLLNSRMKSNAVLGNASSSLSQIANLPQGIADVKNPKHIAEGMANYFKSLGGGGDKALYEQSGFLKERLTDVYSQFDSKIMQQPKKLASWLLGALDETGTKVIWSMEYRKALSEGVQNPIKAADDITRKLVAGRGIGEMPELQRQKVFQLIAPFTLEVGNLWNVQKDFLNDKDFAGLAILYASNFLLNEAMEGVRGSRVVFDPIQAVKEGLEESQGESLMSRAGKIAGSLGGETLGNIPLGQSIGSVYPEFGGDVFGFQLPTREKLFGENDPTRFGTGLPLANAISKPLSSFALPFGGQQIRKTLQGGQALGIIPKLEDGKLKFDPNAKSKKGKLIAPTEKTPESVIKGLLFGKYAIPGVKKFFEENGRLFSENQTASFEDLVDVKGYNPQKLFKALGEVKKAEKTLELPLLGFEKKPRKEKIVKVLEKYYNEEEIDNLLIDYFNYKEGV